MAKKSIRRDVIQIDPMFAIPEGVDELVYEQEGYFVEGSEEQASEESFDSFLYEDDGLDEEVSDGPDTPYIYGVVEQIVRTNPAGNQVIDLVLDVEDIPGDYEYDFKVAKA